MFGRLGTWCHDHRRVVVILWFVALITGGVLNGAVGSDYSTQLKPVSYTHLRAHET